MKWEIFAEDLINIICTKLQNICSCSFRVKNLTRLRGSNEPVSLT
jgi:hypothetical protein